MSGDRAGRAELAVGGVVVNDCSWKENKREGVVEGM